MITTDDGLRAVCEAASAASAVALDTEFVRTRTYYPQLGLLQLFDGTQVSLIDPLTISDWAPMRELLLNQDVTKVLGIDLSRVGQVQRLGLLRYIENPWAMHRKQKRRRVTPQMAQRYLDEQRMAREDSQDNQGKLDDEYVLAGPRRRR